MAGEEWGPSTLGAAIPVMMRLAAYEDYLDGLLARAHLAEQAMNESEFDPRAALGRLSGAAPTEPPAAGGATDPPPPAPTPAEERERRRSAALDLVARYREAHPGDARTDDQLLVAPYGGYELLSCDPTLHPVYMGRLASLRPPPPGGPEP
jgi:hypothetical protein